MNAKITSFFTFWNFVVVFKQIAILLHHLWTNLVLAFLDLATLFWTPFFDLRRSTSSTIDQTLRIIGDPSAFTSQTHWLQSKTVGQTIEKTIIINPSKVLASVVIAIIIIITKYFLRSEKNTNWIFLINGRRSTWVWIL